MPFDPPPRELARRILHQGPVGAYGLCDVEFPGGHRSTLVVLAHPGAAAVVPFLDARRIVLLRQYRHAVGGPIWEIPAGKLDPGEAPEHCAARELREETGYRAGRVVRTGEILTAPGFTDERIHLFCAYDLTPGSAAPEPNESLELHEVELAHALAMVQRGEIIDAKSIAGLFHAGRAAGLLP
jgi:ADP-ribose pyrophosphatase